VQGDVRCHVQVGWPGSLFCASPSLSGLRILARDFRISVMVLWLQVSPASDFLCCRKPVSYDEGSVHLVLWSEKYTTEEGPVLVDISPSYSGF
jgi:hypothetical protein